MCVEPAKNAMSKAEIFLGLARLSQESHWKRSALEWKIAFGLWTAIAAFTYFAVQNPMALQGNLLERLSIAYWGVGFLWVCLHQTTLRRAFDTDKKWKHYYMHKAEGRDTGRSEKDPWRELPSLPERIAECAWKLLQPWVLVQSLPTVLFLIMSFWIISDTRDDSQIRATTQDKASATISGDNLQKVVDKLVE